MSKQNAMPGYYGTTRDATHEEIADSAMRAYGHPWHARKVLLAQRAYLADMRMAEPKYLDAAIEVLEQRTTGEVVVTERDSVYRSTYAHKVNYDIGAILDAWGAPYAASGIRDLCECERDELRNWLFADTLHTALVGIGKALYGAHIFTLTSKGGKTLYCKCEDYEKASRTHKGRNSAKVYLCDANGVELTKPAKWNKDYTDLVSITFGSIATCDRNGLLDYADYTRSESC